MKNEQILKKAIEKAVKNGLDIRELGKKDGWSESELDLETLYNSYYSIIFSHDFAKAFWGIGKPVMIDGQEFYRFKWINIVGEKTDSAYHLTAWQYHLQQMVLEEEPIKYLEKFL